MARIGYIDKLKGMAIMLVVMGHVAELGCGMSDTAFNVMYNSFHMPLFMFLSGVFAFKSFRAYDWGEACAYLRKKALRVAVPFLTVGGIWSAMRLGYPWGTVTGEARGYWFLPALFYDMVWGLVALYAAHAVAPLLCMALPRRRSADVCGEGVRRDIGGA